MNKKMYTMSPNTCILTKLSRVIHKTHKIMLAVSVTDNTHTLDQQKKKQITSNTDELRCSSDTFDNSLNKAYTSEHEDALVRLIHANKFANFLLQRLYRYDNYTFD